MQFPNLNHVGKIIHLGHQAVFYKQILKLENFISED